MSKANTSKDNRPSFIRAFVMASAHYKPLHTDEESSAASSKTFAESVTSTSTGASGPPAPAVQSEEASLVQMAVHHMILIFSLIFWRGAWLLEDYIMKDKNNWKDRRSAISIIIGSGFLFLIRYFKSTRDILPVSKGKTIWGKLARLLWFYVMVFAVSMFWRGWWLLGDNSAAGGEVGGLADCLWSCAIGKAPTPCLWLPTSNRVATPLSASRAKATPHSAPRSICRCCWLSLDQSHAADQLPVQRWYLRRRRVERWVARTSVIARRSVAEGIARLKPCTRRAS